MGADYTAKAIIGVKVDPDKLFTTKTVKAFDHQHPKSMKFDPQTGKPLWKEERKPIDGFNDSDETVAGYSIEWGTDHNEAFICLYVTDDTYSNGGNDSSFCEVDDDISEDKAKMKKALSALGLWSDEDFGMWAVLYCSY